MIEVLYHFRCNICKERVIHQESEIDHLDDLKSLLCCPHCTNVFLDENLTKVEIIT